MFLSELGQNLAINFDILLLEAVDKAAVRKAEAFGAGANLNLPEAAKFSFLDSAVAKSIAASVEKGFCCLS